MDALFSLRPAKLNVGCKVGRQLIRPLRKGRAREDARGIGTGAVPRLDSRAFLP
jgi:hypothetical protein